MSRTACIGMRLRFVLPAALVLAVGVAAYAAPPRKHVIVDGSRARPVHLIPVYDENGDPIRPDDRLPQPLSTEMTCGDCHDYDKISMGWHFNSSLDVTLPGRPGEPWMLIDESSGTQLPLSYRGWAGTWRPQDIGMTQWQFVKQFGHHMPGGDMGEKEDDPPDPNARWDLSGRVEINCLACHDAEVDHNQSEWAVQIGRENFRWAATGASQLGTVLYMASRLPDAFTLINGPNLDNSWAAAPEVVYQAWRFNRKSLVFFDVTREIPLNRCYFCHSTISAEHNADNDWEADADVHVSAGLKCVDCHRNSLDHLVVRGYEGESENPARASLTCEGCHLGVQGDAGLAGMGGRFRAPRPLHRGFPAVHFEKLSCTVCHSGFLPKDKIGRVRTARANRLGIHGRAQWDTKLPYILSPVFVRQDNGKIEPREMVWPAFWGRMKGDTVTPLPMARVTLIVEALRETERQAKLEIERQRTEAAARAEAAQKPAEEAKPAEPEKKEEGEPKDAGAGDEAETASAAPKGQTEQPTVVVDESPPPIGGTCSVQYPKEAPPSDEIAPLTEAQIVKVLKDLAAQPDLDGQPVYVSGGKVYRLSGEALTPADNAVTQPYSWPIAHDVRPAAQSLGSGGCGDCHADNSPFFFAEVSADSPTGLGTPVVKRMHELQDLDPTLLDVLDEAADFRLAYIIGGIVIAVILAAALIHYGFLGLEGFLRLLVASDNKK